MSNYQEIDSLEDKLTEMIRGRATYRERLGEIERDENLSSTGRHTEAVELCEKAKAKHKALRAAYDAEVEETRQAVAATHDRLDEVAEWVRPKPQEEHRGWWARLLGR